MLFSSESVLHDECPPQQGEFDIIWHKLTESLVEMDNDSHAHAVVQNLIVCCVY
jgi:hypothetical protein